MTGNRPLRVLVNAINDNAHPRGPDRYLTELIKHMVALPGAPHIHLLYAPWQRFFDGLDLGPAGQRTEIAAPRSPVLRLLWQATVFPRLANRLGADIVFLPNLIWTPGLRLPSVVTAHDLLHFRCPEKFGQLKAALLRFVIRKALAKATQVIAVSEFTAADAKTFGRAAARNLSVILEGGPKPCPRRVVTTTDPLFLFVGKVERTKNIDLLIRAFLSSEVLKEANAQLVIVGPDGNATADIAPLLALGEGRVIRPGFVSDEELEQLYATARGFVFPSTAEGFGLVILEAMARGAPVVAAAATSLPEVVGDAGILVPPGDAPALAKAMERLATDTALAARLTTAGYARLKDFSWERAARETLTVLDAAAQEGQR